MLTPLLYTGISLSLFIFWLILCEVEKNKNKRLFLEKFRSWLDNQLNKLVNWLIGVALYVSKYVITLSWYYSLHHTLKIFLQFIAGIYQVIEKVLLKNRDRARALRREKKLLTKQPVSHLTEIAEHKAETKLTPAEARKRKDRALKGE